MRYYTERYRDDQGMKLIEYVLLDDLISVHISNYLASGNKVIRTSKQKTTISAISPEISILLINGTEL